MIIVVVYILNSNIKCLLSSLGSIIIPKSRLSSHIIERVILFLTLSLWMGCCYGLNCEG